MDPISLICPNCGAGLSGPAESGQYLCAYCQYGSIAPRTDVEQARHATTLAIAPIPALDPTHRLGLGALFLLSDLPDALAGAWQVRGR